LAALVPKELNFEIDIVDEGVQKLNIQDKKYDIVGITCVASSAPRAYELAKIFKTQGSFIFMGGAHPTLNPEEVSAYADVVVVGYAEVLWPELLQKFVNQEKLDKIYYSSKQEIVSTVIPAREKLAKGRYLNIPTVIASRGCIHSCSFCSIHKIWNNSPCYRPVDEVIEEMKLLNNNRMIMLDPNIIADKAYATELFEKMIPLKKKWGGLATINLAEDKNLLHLAVKSGCIGILVGFESVMQQSMIECGKGSYDTTKYKEFVREFHKNGISILGCFVLGFDNDDETVFEKTVKFVDEIEIDVPRFAVLTPFPGTFLYKKLLAENRIITNDLTLYDTEHVVFKPANMSPERLQKGLHETWKSTYTFNRILKRTMRFPESKFFGFIINSGFRYYSNKIANEIIK